MERWQYSIYSFSGQCDRPKRIIYHNQIDLLDNWWEFAMFLFCSFDLKILDIYPIRHEHQATSAELYRKEGREWWNLPVITVTVGHHTNSAGWWSLMVSLTANERPGQDCLCLVQTRPIGPSCSVRHSLRFSATLPFFLRILNKCQ